MPILSSAISRDNSMFLPKSLFSQTLPLSLYIHIPWCVRKCPYCDFNSHAAKNDLPMDLYVAALLHELDQHLSLIPNRPLMSIFFGGGTPSLFSAHAIEKILRGVEKRIAFHPQIEITLEANPGTIDQVRFREFYQVGINRLSLGIQSLQNEKLQSLGRIHDRDHAIRAIEITKEAGFSNFNLDLMYGLPNQSIDDALADLTMALSHQPPHLSWYQLTIEPNTLFHHQPPPLPADDLLWEMQSAGLLLLRDANLHQYEVSAFAQHNNECRHNRNYWEFGDYLGIGAGAHSKITTHETNQVLRFSQVKNPRGYLITEKRKITNTQILSATDLIFEFMLNALRLTSGVPIDLFTERTGLSLSSIQAHLQIAKNRGLIVDDNKCLRPTELGKKFLNNLVEIFLPK